MNLQELVQSDHLIKEEKRLAKKRQYDKERNRRKNYGLPADAIIAGDRLWMPFPWGHRDFSDEQPMKGKKRFERKENITCY